MLLDDPVLATVPKALTTESALQARIATTAASPASERIRGMRPTDERALR